MARSVVSRAFVTLRSRNLAEDGAIARGLILVLCCFRSKAAPAKKRQTYGAAMPIERNNEWKNGLGSTQTFSMR
jgi:hypothetical protein